MNLPNYHVYLKLMIDGTPIHPLQCGEAALAPDA